MFYNIELTAHETILKPTGWNPPGPYCAKVGPAATSILRTLNPVIVPPGVVLVVLGRQRNRFFLCWEK